MARIDSWSPRRVRLVFRSLVALGVAAMLALASLVGIAIDASAAGTSLQMTSSSAGVTCDNSNPAQPVCSHLAGGDVITLAGTSFTPGSLASAVQCNSDPHQPVILFLGNYIPISCTPLKLSQISPGGGFNPPPFTVVQGTTGPVLNNPSSFPPTCTIDPTKGKPPLPGQSGPIPGCTTTGDPVTDAANFPCPPSAAQQTAGDDCVMAIGDQAGDRGVGVVLFGNETLPTTTTTTTLSTTTSPTSTSTATHVSSGTISFGAANSVTDAVTVHGTATNGSPTGNVSFYVCETGTTTTLTTGPCAPTTANHLSTVALTPGASDASTASSASFVPTAPGTWCFSATYGGGTIYTGSADNTTGANLDANECVLVAPGATSTSSAISTTGVVLGPAGRATDAVTVAGNALGGSPSGTVAFYACHTGITQTLTTAPCPPGGTPIDTEALTSGAGATSSTNSLPFAPTSVGTWCFSAAYSGNATYAGSGDNTGSATLDPAECLLVAPPLGDAITSDPNVVATAGTLFTFLVTTSGSPTPSVKKHGALPRGVHFANNHNGTATISGTPPLKQVGPHHLTLIATFGKGKAKQVVTQAFDVTVVP